MGRCKRFLSSLLPPGFRWEEENKNLLWTVGLTLLFSLWTYGQLYQDAYKRLFDSQITDRRVLLPDAVMPDFAELLYHNLWIYLFMALVLLIEQVFHRYRYFRQGTRADYTLRRLPQKYARFRYCWSLPLLEAAGLLILGIVMALLYFAGYMVNTPEPCIPPGQWQKLWEAGWGFLL